MEHRGLISLPFCFKKKYYVLDVMTSPIVDCGLKSLLTNSAKCQAAVLKNDKSNGFGSNEESKDKIALVMKATCMSVERLILTLVKGFRREGWGAMWKEEPIIRWALALLDDYTRHIEVVDLSAWDTKHVNVAIGELVWDQDEEWGARMKTTRPRSKPPRRAT